MTPLDTPNHLAVLEYRAAIDGSASMLKVPRPTKPGTPQEWSDITVGQLATDVKRVAHFLAGELRARKAPPRSVVSLWFSGYEYPHLVYILALARASYIPQPFSHNLTHQGIIFELMEKAGSKAIIYDPSFEPMMTDCPFPNLPITPIGNCPQISDDSALPNVEDLCSSDEGIYILFLTSGSTSGSPKLVPTKWTSMYIMATRHLDACLQGKPYETQDVLLARGSICYLAHMANYIGCLYRGCCFVQPPRIRISTDEMQSMVDVCGLNRLSRYGTQLSDIIEIAKKDPKMLKLLQGMRIVTYDGVPISFEDDDWCFQNGIILKDLFGSTECGLIMTSAPEKPSRFLLPIPGVSCKFVPVLETTQPGSLTPTQLFEFVLLEDSLVFPPPHLLSADGNFHSGDLFELQPDSTYIYRGRNDDWIKSYDAGRCDARSIEAHVRMTCGDLIKECIVVGNLRPCPALFIEALDYTVPEDTLKEVIFERMKDFNNRRCDYERVTDKRLISIVPSGTLPRTFKGNLRRKATEERYSNELDALYLSVYGPAEDTTVSESTPPPFVGKGH